MQETTAVTARKYAFYFAYGSNMASERLASRVPAVRKYANAELPGYCLRFHKVGADGSGKCDVVRSESPDAIVHGVLFSVQDADLGILDRIEGSGYTRVSVSVSTATGAVLHAATYIATQTDAGLQPYCWYREHVLRGATANSLPAAWIAALEAVECCKDPDDARHARELAIYGVSQNSASSTMQAPILPGLPDLLPPSTMAT